MFKIRYIIGSLGRGGAEHHLVTISNELIKAGYDIKIVLLNEDTTLASRLDPKVIVKPLYTARYTRKLPKLFRIILTLIMQIWHLTTDRIKDRRDINHFFLPNSYIVGSISHFLFNNKEKCVMSRRSLNNYQKKYPGMKNIESFLHKRMNLVLGNSKRVIDQLLYLEKSPKSTTKLIYNGINLNRFSDKIIKNDYVTELKLKTNVVHMVIVANLIPYKGHDDLIEALNLVSKKYEWNLYIIGKNSVIKNNLLKKVQKYNLDNSVYFLGSIDNTDNWLKAADIGLLTSHEEGFSNSLLEYMAAELAIIATDVGGNSEAITKDCGKIVPPNNPILLAKAIEEFLNNADKRLYYGKNAKERVKKEFSLQKCVDNYIKEYSMLKN